MSEIEIKDKEETKADVSPAREEVRPNVPSAMAPPRKEAFVLPVIGAYSRLVKFVLGKAGQHVYYRGQFSADLLSNEPSDVFYLATRAFGEFLKVAVRGPQTENLARRFSLNSDVLLRAGRELYYKRMQFEFDFAYQAAQGRAHLKAQVIVPVAKRLRNCMNELWDTSESKATGNLSLLGFCCERAGLLVITLLKITYAAARLVQWRLGKTSPLAAKVSGNFIWLPGGPTEISFDPQKLSLPVYLRELLKAGKFGKERFAVLCSFLKPGQSWDEPHSFSIPLLRNIAPGLSAGLFAQGMKDLGRVLAGILIAVWNDSEEMDLLSLLPQMILERAWLKSVPVKAVFVTESSAGCALPLVHAAREAGIPVGMVFYSADMIPVVLNRSNLNIVPQEFQYIMADHLCVWSASMGEWFEKIGYAKENIHCVGPQMFAPVILNGVAKQSSKKIRIGLFDNIPLKSETYVKWGKGESIKKEQYILNFRRSAAEAMRKVFGDDLVIVSKMKREPASTDNNRIPDWGEKMKMISPELDRFVELKAPNSNPWTMVDELDAVISIAYTSLSEAAYAMGKPAAFYDPARLIVPRPGEVPLLRGADELAQWLGKLRDGRSGITNTRSAKLGPAPMAEALQKILDQNRS